MEAIDQFNALYAAIWRDLQENYEQSFFYLIQQKQKRLEFLKEKGFDLPDEQVDERLARQIDHLTAEIEVLLNYATGVVNCREIALSEYISGISGYLEVLTRKDILEIQNKHLKTSLELVSARLDQEETITQSLLFLLTFHAPQTTVGRFAEVSIHP